MKLILLQWKNNWLVSLGEKIQDYLLKEMYEHVESLDH